MLASGCASAGGRWVRADGWPWSGSGCCCIGGGFWAAEGWFGGCAQTGSAIATSAATLIAPTTFFMCSAPEWLILPSMRETKRCRCVFVQPEIHARRRKQNPSPAERKRGFYAPVYL
jgi:hypothetical protein